MSEKSASRDTERAQRIRRSLCLYAVTDSGLLKGKTLVEAVEEALAGGATMIQLREKNKSDESLLTEARALLSVCHRYHVPLIINDNVEVCAQAHADGVHLGMEDLPPDEARRRLGPDAIIGATAHSLEEALAGERAGADYIGAGAAFPSPTKPNVRPMEPDTYRQITSAVHIPVTAIGGINASNIGKLSGLGLAGAAVISAIFGADDIRAASTRLLEQCRKLQRG